ncbi:MAG: LysR substrate-binding domain-containing protein [Acidimicrobiales bacterium]
MDFTIQQLRLLREVATRGTIAAAAAAVGYTPSAVSQQLASLERAVGTPPLERVGRNVRLTDAGRELVHHGDEILARVEETQVAIERLQGEARGELSISVYESVGSTLLAPLLKLIAVRHPALRLRSRFLDPEFAIDSLAMGELDLAFAIDYADAPEEPRTDVIRELVLNDQFFLVVPDDDDLTGPTVSLDKVADRPFVASPPHLSCGRYVVMACRRHGFEPDVVHQLDDYPTTLRLVAAGVGVSLVPSLGLVDVPPGVRAIPLRTPVVRQVQLAYRTASADRPAIGAIRTALADVVADLETIGDQPKAA